MELIRTIREKHQNARQAGIREEAERLITIDDFESSLYIASSILDESNDYDMTWHKSYCKELTNLCNDTLKILRS